MNRPLRVAFPPVGGEVWTGGQNYLANLCQQLLQHAPDRITPVLFVNHDYAPELMREVEAAGAELVRDDFFARSNLPKRMIKTILTGKDRKAIAVYKQHQIDCLFESATYHGWNCPIPALSWMPDFQHHHLPHLFSKKAWWHRELGFRLSLLGKANVMLSSEDARSDLTNHYGWSSAQPFVIPFAVPSPEPVTEEEISAIQTEHGLPDQWFYCPNQFWEHKNHEVLLHALEIAVKENPDICLVCTGTTTDVRNPDYFRRLTALAKKLNVDQCFRVLGLVPYPHVRILMQGSLALVNPSKFEGWSTVVEEAKVSGSKLILSDLAVHKEQCGDEAVYFGCNDPAALANALTSFKGSPPRSPNIVRPGSSEDGCQKFAANFANAIEAIVSKA